MDEMKPTAEEPEAPAVGAGLVPAATKAASAARAAEPPAEAPRPRPPAASTAKKPAKKKPAKSPDNFEWRWLKAHEPFRLVFDDGKAIQAKLAGIDRYNLVVVTRQNKLFVPKRSIKYIILKETATGPEASAEQPGAATGTSEVG